jgi:hypothetical protein
VSTNLPKGFRIERRDESHAVVFEIFEDGGPTWPSGDPRGLLDVIMYKPSFGRETPEVSWPSTSDKRPVLAFAVAAAIAMAAEEAHEWS